MNELETWEMGVRLRCLILEDVGNSNDKIQVAVSFVSHLLISFLENTSSSKKKMSFLKLNLWCDIG